MLKPNEENMMTTRVDFKLDDRQRGILASYVKQEGFDIIQLLFEDVVKKFTMELVNTAAEDDKAVLANHKMTKCAAQIYTEFINRLAEEVGIFMYNAEGIGTPQNPENPMAMTEFN